MRSINRTLMRLLTHQFNGCIYDVGCRQRTTTRLILEIFLFY